MKAILGKISRDIKLGMASLSAHKLRSFLTALGIVFGVASVICMLAIGEGMSHEAMETIRRMGSNNIILRSSQPPRDTDGGNSTSRVSQYGLTYADIDRITATVPRIETIVPTRELRKDIWFGSRRIEGNIVGTTPGFTDLTNRHLVAGRFITDVDMRNAANVAVLSMSAARNLTTVNSPMNGFVRVGDDYYRVVGILEGGAMLPAAGGQSPAAETSNEIYIPLTAARARFGELIVTTGSGTQSMERIELHGAIIRVADSDYVVSTSDIIERALKQNRSDRQDFEIVVPLQLLRERERMRRLYNTVLGLMAAISLIVGGIGIMNIMLATVSERTPEIGVRRALGAKKRDIMAQFLIETIMLSGCGGLIGVFLGVSLPWLITKFTEMTAIVTWWAIILAFAISGITGLFFGFYPAVRAAGLNPISALRHE